jgi:hypothetical protein
MNHALLSIAFPEFRFDYQPRAPWAPRWVAVRKDIRTPGVHTVVTDDLDELLALLGKAAVLMFPPWGILPPRHMMTRTPCAGCGCERHFRLPAIWWWLFRKALRKNVIRQLPERKGERHAAP